MGLTLVYGTGKSGIAAAKLLCKMGEEVVLFDEKEDVKDPKIEGASLITKEIPDKIQKDLTEIVLSPGVPTDLPRINEWRDRGLEIIGEIELAARFSKGDILGITGTNGKTTTTALLGTIIKEVHEDTRVVGNIGIPFTEMVEGSSEKTVYVAEISSFQLETVKDFSPRVSAILNITPDHLDRHHTMEAYINAKEAIALKMKNDGVVVLNYEDKVLREFGESLGKRVIWFSSERELEEGYFLRDKHIIKRFDKEETDIICVDELNILGKHNHENAMAAIAMACAYNISIEKIQKALKAFKAVEHRIEYVCEKRGVKYYDDSKGTNTDAAIKGIEAMERPTVLIAGGYDKNADYTDWVKLFDGRVKALILIGQTADAIEACARGIGYTNIYKKESLKEAVDLADELSSSGDAVLLSPACASWGMFKDYNQRGDMFKEYARELKD